MPHFTDNSSREFEALRLAARLPLDDAQQLQLAALASTQINADELTRLAIRHGVAPLLAHHLHCHCPALLTPALQQYAQRNAIRAQFLTQALVEMLQAFAQAGIQAVPFKGPALALAAYGALGWRDFCDLDVLVHPAQLDEAERVCVAHGFTRKRRFAQDHDADVRRFNYDLPMMRQRDGVVIELHWALTFNYAGVLFERLKWHETLTTIALNKRAAPAPALASEETLLLLCLHGSKDGWDKLKLPADVAQLLRATPAFDWPRCWRLARDIRAEQLVRIALRLADELLDAPLPDELRAALRADASLVAPLRHAAALLLNEQDAAETVIARHAFFLQTQRRWWEKLRYCARYALTPGSTEWQRIQLPASLSAGYRLLRLARLTKFYGLRWLTAGASEKS